MDKSSQADIELSEQRRAWNRWNAQTREIQLGEVSRRQAALVEGWLASMGRHDLELADVGCGTGWMCERLLPFGHVTGIDLADEVIQRARERLPSVTFIAGDFASIEVREKGFDVVVKLEVLAHVADQGTFVERLARLLRPGGYLMMATQNRPVLNRWSAIGRPIPGQIRRWVDARALRQLLRPHFRVLTLTSVLPVGDQGMLRLVNSVKLNRFAGALAGQARLDRIKERLLLGHTLMVLARKR